MRKIFKRKISFFYYLYLLTAFLLIWFLSINWLPSGYAITGHDSGLALDTKLFVESRFKAWDDRINFGQDNSQHFGSLTIHVFDYLLSVLANVPYAGNSLSLFFWLILIFSSSFIFAYSLKKDLGKYSPFFFPVFTIFNFYIFQSVFILERAKFGLLAATFLFLTVVFKVLDKNMSIIVGAGLSSLIFFFFNGGSWLGLPLYGGIAVITVILVLFYLFLDFRNKSFSNSKRLLSFLTLTLAGYLMVNSYSILPYISTFLAGDYSLLSDSAVRSGNRDWLDYISERTSLINLLRLQGVPDWYSESNLANPLHPYSGKYINNAFFIIMSFLLPLFGFSSLLLAKTKSQKKILTFFALLVLIGIFFSAGSHPPLGFIYAALFENISLFSIFRSPYYKFGVIFTLGMAVMSAFALNQLIEISKNKFSMFISKWFININLQFFKTVVGYSLSMTVIALWLGYHYALFNPNDIFLWRENLGTKQKPPVYVYEFNDWSKAEIVNDKRILLLPPLNGQWKNDAYSWGYWSLSTLYSTLSPAQIVSNDSSLTGSEKAWVDELYSAIERQDEQLMRNLSNRLNIGYFLLRNDVLAEGWSSTNSPEVYTQSFTEMQFAREKAAFGPWRVFELPGVEESKVKTTGSLVLTPPIANTPSIIEPEEHAVVSDLPHDAEEFINKKVQVLNCLSCELETGFGPLELPGTQILPNSLLYRFKERSERDLLAKSLSPDETIYAYYGFVLRRTSELHSLISLENSEDTILKSVQGINTYLEQAYNLEQDSIDTKNFYRAKYTSQIVQTLEANLAKYITGNDADRISYKVQQEILAVLWQVKRIKDLYKPLTGNLSRWEKEKVYSINIPERGSKELFININAVTDGKGKREEDIVQAVLLRTNGIKQTLTFEQIEEHKLKIILPLGITTNASSELVLLLGRLPNLFRPQGTSLMETPGGTRSCYLGDILGFKAKTKYRIKIKTPDKEDKLKLIIQGGKTKETPKHGFLYSSDELDIPAMPRGEPFVTYYSQPEEKASSPSILICGRTEDSPSIEYVEVNEVYSPELYLISTLNKEISNHPKVSYQKIDSTKYIVNMEEGGDGAFILMFNEHFSPLWKIYDVEPGTDKKKINEPAGYKHFQIDGYANAWKIDSPDKRSFIIEYAPQSLLYKGLVVSGISLTGIIGYLAFRLIRKPRNVA